MNKKRSSRSSPKYGIYGSNKVIPFLLQFQRNEELKNEVAAGIAVRVFVSFHRVPIFLTPLAGSDGEEFRVNGERRGVTESERQLW